VLLAEKAQLERDLRDLSDKLSSALSECDAKDELAKKHAKTAQEALAGSLCFFASLPLLYMVLYHGIFQYSSMDFPAMLI